MLQKRLIARTKKHELRVDCYFNLVPVNEVIVNKSLFAGMCEEGCNNYNKKYCCPPHSPSYHSQVEEGDDLLVALFAMGLEQLNGFNYLDYHKLRIGNAVLKSRVEKLMRSLEDMFNSEYMSTGSCRLCKPCRLKKGEPCKHPEKMRYSLESLGVDCNHLTEAAFNKRLLWYEDKKAPEYTSVVCALPISEDFSKETVFDKISQELERDYELID